LGEDAKRYACYVEFAAPDHRETQMADTVVHIGENSPEHVAYKLMEKIADVEGRHLRHSDRPDKIANRKWILDTYAECIRTVRAPSGRGAAAMIKDDP